MARPLDGSLAAIGFPMAHAATGSKWRRWRRRCRPDALALILHGWPVPDDYQLALLFFFLLLLNWELKWNYFESAFLLAILDCIDWKWITNVLDFFPSLDLLGGKAYGRGRAEAEVKVHQMALDSHQLFLCFQRRDVRYGRDVLSHQSIRVEM